MRIGELARRAGVSPRSLRHYERHGLIEARRDDHGWRDYDETAVPRVRAIAELIASGLTLAGVKDLKPCLDAHDDAACEDVELPVRTYRSRLAVVDRQLAGLHEARAQLVDRLHALRPGDSV